MMALVTFATTKQFHTFFSFNFAKTLKNLSQKVAIFEFRKVLSV